METALGTALYRNILREYGCVNQPKLIRDAAVKRKVLQMLESATRGLSRLDAVTKPLDGNTVKELLAKLQAHPLDKIADLKTLQHVVLGLEELAGPNDLRTERWRINYAPPFQDGLNRSELATWAHATSPTWALYVNLTPNGPSSLFR